MKIIAHRGLSESYPENTLLAFQKAIEASADGIETDLRLTADNEIVLFHDKDLNRIAKTDSKIEDLTLSELKQFDLGEGESIVRVDELISLVDGKLTLILEIKYNLDTYKKLCEILVKKIADKLDWVEVSCFEDRVLEYMHLLDPHIKLHKIIGNVPILEDKQFAFCNDTVSYLDVDIALRDTVLKKGLMQKYKVIFWTVDKEDIHDQEKEAGLYGIMSNKIG